MTDSLRFQITPSRIEAVLVTAAHAIALLALWLARLPLTISIAATIVILINLIFAGRRHAIGTRPNGAIAVELREGGAVALQRRGGEWREYRLHGSTFVSPLMAVVNLREAGSWHTTSILIAAGTLDPVLFRRLRVWLKWRATNSAADSLSDAH